MEITFGVLIFCIVAFFVAGFIDSIAGGAGFVTAPSLLLRRTWRSEQES